MSDGMTLDGLDLDGVIALQQQIADLQAQLEQEREAKGADVLAFANLILHGDSAHRKWLLDAANAYAEGKPLPEFVESSVAAVQAFNKDKSDG